MTHDLRLTASQIRAIETPGSIAVEAGPGSGKTETLIRRVCHQIAGGVDPGAILVLAFSRDARETIQARLPAHAGHVRVETLHSFCLKQVREFSDLLGYSESGGRNVPRVADTAERTALFKQALQALTNEARGLPLHRLEMDALQSAISALKLTVAPCEPAHAPTPYRAAMDELLRRYDQRLRAKGLVDFDDLIRLGHRLARLPEPSAIWQAHFASIVVDEVQDLSAAEMDIVLALTGPGSTLALFGDSAQSVYGWRGALGGQAFARFEARFPAAAANRIYIAENQRSRHSIVAVCDRLLAGNRPAQTAMRGEGPPVYLLSAATEIEQAGRIAGIASAALTAGVAPAQIAVLARTHAQLAHLEREFVRASVACAVLDRGSVFERKAVRDIAAFLRLTQMPPAESLLDRAALARVLTIDGFGLDAEAVRALRGDDDEIDLAHLLDPERVATLGMFDQQRVRRVLDALVVLNNLRQARSGVALGAILACPEIAYQAHLDAIPAAERQLISDELTRLAAQHPDIQALVDELDLLAGGDPLAPAPDRVTLATLHAAKGRQWPLVFIAGVNEGWLPHFNAQTHPDALREELRLAYVGMSRPQDVLVLCHCRARTNQSGQLEECKPSRFFGLLRGGPIERIGADVPDWRAIGALINPSTPSIAKSKEQP